MSVLVKGAEMPISCSDCKIRLSVGCCGNLPQNTRMPNCPLIEVPRHGRLIDADVLNYTMLYKENWMRGTGVEAPAIWRKDIDAAPTIIPAEESE